MREIIMIVTALGTTMLVAANITAWFLICGGRHGIALAALAAACAVMSGIAGAIAQGRR